MRLMLVRSISTCKPRVRRASVSSPSQRKDVAAAALFCCPSFCAQADVSSDAATADRLDALQRLINRQVSRLDTLKQSMRPEESSLGGLRRALRAELLALQRAHGVAPVETLAQVDARGAIQPAGQAPEAEGGAPAGAPIFEQVSVLTPKNKKVIEPSFQYSYSSSNRIAQVGYTVIPTILVGVVGVVGAREVKRNTFAAALTGRDRLTNRWEVKARAPCVPRSDTDTDTDTNTGIGREILQGQANNAAFNPSSGSGSGDIQLTARHQLNDGSVTSLFWPARCGGRTSDPR